MAVLSIDVADINGLRGPSQNIWKDCPVLQLRENFAYGMLFEDDFIGFPGAGLSSNGERNAGKWNLFIANSASAVVGTAADPGNLPLEGGVMGMTVGANANLSISMAAPCSAYNLVSAASGFPLKQKLWFEASVAFSSLTSGAFDFFVGLMDTGENAGTRITSAADLIFSSNDTIKTGTGNGGCVGFWKRAATNPNDMAFVFNKNNGTAQNLGSTTIQKLMATYGPGNMTPLAVSNNQHPGVAAVNAFNKFGFIFDPSPVEARRIATAVGNETQGNSVRPLLKLYVNGVEVPVFLDSTILQGGLFSTTNMAPVIGFRSASLGSGTAFVDWIRVAQLGSV